MVLPQQRRRVSGRRRPPGPLVAALLAASLSLPACAQGGPRPIRPEEDLYDPSPGRRTDAVLTVAKTRDAAHVPALIELLADPDPAVRMATGATLRDLTGHDTGYVAYAPPDALRAQVLGWRAWWSGGGVEPAAPTPAAGIPVPAPPRSPAPPSIPLGACPPPPPPPPPRAPPAGSVGGRG